MKFAIFGKEVNDEDDEAEDPARHEPKQAENIFPKLIIPVLLFATALAVRLIYLYFFAKPENANPYWYGDVYHRWQIAILSRDIGFSHGFLRLWDLKGLEYFWGLLYPLAVILIFTITRSDSIVLLRLFSIVCGAFVVALIYLILKKYFNFLTGFFAAIFAIFFPVALFTDTTGEQEPFGLALLLFGVLLWGSAPFWAGFFWGLASMVRAEYWIFTFGLLVFTLVREKNFERKILLFLGWIIPIGFYMKVLLDRTGNPIYPVWWNFFGNAAGQWFTKVPLNNVQITAQWIGRAMAGLGLLGALFIFIKKPKSWPLFALGFANVTFIGLMFGFSAYVYGFIIRFWVDRLLYWPYLFAAILVSIGLFWHTRKFKLVAPISILVFIVLIAATQLSWPIIRLWEMRAMGTFDGEKALAAEIALKYQNDGSLLIFEDRPVVIYALVHYFGINPKNLVSEMYDPFFYAGGEQAFYNWGEVRPVFFKWIRDNNIKWIVVDSGRKTYKKLFEVEPQAFEKFVDIPNSNYQLVKVVANE